MVVIFIGVSLTRNTDPRINYRTNRIEKKNMVTWAHADGAQNYPDCGTLGVVGLASPA